jgi:alpha-mannosidase
MRVDVRDLVGSGRLELVSGGWTMHDESCTLYDDMIINMKEGHRFIEREFNYKPRVGWQVDTFGHSSTNALLFAEMGFDALFFARMDA